MPMGQSPLPKELLLPPVEEGVVATVEVAVALGRLKRGLLGMTSVDSFSVGGPKHTAP